jgi:hypothetical protein
VFPHWDFNNLTNGNPAANDYVLWWKGWLDDNESYELFKKTGYFSKRLRLITDRLVKVIVLNTETCDIENHNVYATLYDPMSQLDFLLRELDMIEKNQGLAIVSFHITPDDGCNHEFAVRYKAILDRYQHIIRMNLMAHTHTDLFKVAMSYSNPVMPVGILTVCGSVTTWGG